ncbi:MAG: ATP cone domain-containing protein [Candidatus Roizmanbacteria bacterium]|nr:ATP cone domain-containing protein [Candidatus Roizmanbacteria bacterium]
MSKILVMKSDGTTEHFSANKVRHAIERAGIPASMSERVLDHIRSIAYQNITTTEIHRHIVEFLSYSYPQGVCRFNLKNAIMRLGPTGFPFERFVARLLEKHGYKTEVDIYVLGQCVKHEVDVLATKENDTYFVECKYHNHSGIRSDIKTALYVYARGEDLKQGKKGTDGTYEPWLFTNTKLTGDAIAFGECRSMRITGWGYPTHNNLQDMVEEKKCYPITVLSSISLIHMQQLLKENIVMIQDITQSPAVLETLDIGYIRRHALLEEIEQLSA